MRVIEPSSITGRKVLLRAVEAMDLVDEQERPLPLRAARARGVEDFLQFRDARVDG